MATNFMEAGTEVQSIISDIEKSKSDIAKIVANAIVSRAKQGKVNQSLSKDINGILKDLPVEDRYEVMLSVAYYLANTGSFGNVSSSSGGTKKRKSDDDYDFFGRRGF